MKQMNRIIKLLMVIVILMSVISCKNLDQRVMEVVEERENLILAEKDHDFGNPPENYEEKIKEYFLKVQKVHHPENLDFKIGKPQIFYELGGLIKLDHVKWMGWIVEVAIPDSAIYKYGSSKSLDYSVYFVTFENNEIVEAVSGVDYSFMKKFGYIRDEDGEINEAMDKTAILDEMWKFIRFRDEESFNSNELSKVSGNYTEKKGRNKSEQLKGLMDDYKKGVINKVEFETERKKILEI